MHSENLPPKVPEPASRARVIDVSALESLTPGKAGPWRLGEDRLLRITADGRPVCTYERAQALFETYAGAWASGVGTPRPYEIVRVVNSRLDAADMGIGECWGVVVEYVRGLGLNVHCLVGSYSFEEAARELGGLQRRLHAARVDKGVDWHARFRTYAHRLAPSLPSGMGARLVSLVEDIPPASTLLHGDLHMANVVVRGGRPVPIDMESTGFGHPVFDLAVSRSRLLYGVTSYSFIRGIPDDEAKKVQHAVWHALLRAYLGASNADAFAEVERRVAVLSVLENCSRRYLAPGGCANRTMRPWPERLARTEELLGRFLPTVDRLDFDVPSYASSRSAEKGTRT